MTQGAGHCADRCMLAACHLPASVVVLVGVGLVCLGQQLQPDLGHIIAAQHILHVLACHVDVHLCSGSMRVMGAAGWQAISSPSRTGVLKARPGAWGDACPPSPARP